MSGGTPFVRRIIKSWIRFGPELHRARITILPLLVTDSDAVVESDPSGSLFWIINVAAFTTVVQRCASSTSSRCEPRSFGSSLSDRITWLETATAMDPVPCENGQRRRRGLLRLAGGRTVPSAALSLAHKPKRTKLRRIVEDSCRRVNERQKPTKEVPDNGAAQSRPLDPWSS